MTIVATMEEFEALTPGTIITVNGNNNLWERTEAGWSKDGVSLESIHFTGDVNNKRVNLGAAPEAGQVWDSATWTHILLELDGDHWWYARFNKSGRFSTLGRFTSIPGSLTPPSEHPEWYANANAMARTMLTLRQKHDMAAEASLMHSAALSKMRAEVQPLLQRAVDAYPDFLTHANEFLESNNMDACQVEVLVSVQARVQKYVAVPVDSLRPLVPEGAEVKTGSTTLASFEIPLEVKVRRPMGQCACPLVTRRTLLTRLTEMGERDLYDYSILSRSCPNDPVAEAEPVEDLAF